MTTKTPAVKPATKLHTCEGCGQTGSVGAKWLLYFNDDPQPKLVHRPCGETLIAKAPEGVNARLVPSRQLREEWRTTRMARSFWGTAFGNAKPLKPATKAREQVEVTVTKPTTTTATPAPTETVQTV